MAADIVRTWVAGWAVSRRTPPPAEKPWGFYIEVACNADEVGRHVLPEADELLVRSAAASVSVPRTWMKMPAEPEEIEPWLSQGWVMAWEETGHLMAVDLMATDPVAPEGYTTTMETIGAVTYARVLDAAGEQAAQGQMASLGEAVVVDRVMTEDAHRRRGLGHFVMRTLADHALETGAVLGVLGATDAGRARCTRRWAGRSMRRWRSASTGPEAGASAVRAESQECQQPLDVAGLAFTQLRSGPSCPHPVLMAWDAAPGYQ